MWHFPPPSSFVSAAGSRGPPYVGLFFMPKKERGPAVGGCRGGEAPPGESTAAATPPGHAAHAEPGAKSLTDATDSAGDASMEGAAARGL